MVVVFPPVLIVPDPHSKEIPLFTFVFSQSKTTDSHSMILLVPPTLILYSPVILVPLPPIDTKLFPINSPDSSPTITEFFHIIALPLAPTRTLFSPVPLSISP